MRESPRRSPFPLEGEYNVRYVIDQGMKLSIPIIVRLHKLNKIQGDLKRMLRSTLYSSVADRQSRR